MRGPSRTIAVFGGMSVHQANRECGVFSGKFGGQSRDLENGDLLTIEGIRVTTDWVGQRAAANLRYERWRDNLLIETQLEPMSQRYWGIDEFTLALRSTDFGDIKVVGNYDRRRAPRSGDRTFTFEAVRI